MKQPIKIFVDKQTATMLRKAAFIKGCSLSEYVRTILIDYIKARTK